MKKTVLIVDDNVMNRLLLSNLLSEDYNILEAECGETALKILSDAENHISAVLLDISMPGISGYEVLQNIRNDSSLSKTPVIMITGSEDDSSRVKSLSLGANDFVMKPYSPDVIKHCLQSNITMRELSVTIHSLQCDKLTGLYNREPFFENAEKMISAHEPGYYIMSCFDVDGFKIVNDQYGMEKGDEVLKHIGDVFTKGFVPIGGICCRIAADNFAVLYPASFKDSDEIKAIRSQATYVEGLAVPIIFSIGRYIVDDLTLSPSTMYDRANIAVNSVKNRYDNKIGLYDESMRQSLIKKQEIVQEMKSALESFQFEVWFQPQYNHSTNALIGSEALVRWRHPTKGLISPNDFIPLFEQNGFIYSLDKYVWEEVCLYLRKWIDKGRNPLPVSVNISRYDILCPDLVNVIKELVKKYDIPVNYLRLEVTESAFSNSSKQVIDVVKALIDYGFTVEIDDFGSGYSSLNTLKDVPAQVLKLDMKFLESTSDTQRGGNIVESVVRMAKWLGMSIIAEGVETRNQADYLRSIGCNYIQGFLYARPMPADEYEEYFVNPGREEHMLSLQTVENLDNNSFWDPDSMDTLIFNSYVGGACIFEYYNGDIELLRATKKYCKVIGSAEMTVEDALKIKWSEHMTKESMKHIIEDIEKSISSNSEIVGEYVFLDLPCCPHETHLRSTLRVIATAGDHHLVYCTNENITAQHQAEKRERQSAEEALRLSEQIAAIMDNVDLGIIGAVVEGESAEYIFANSHYYAMLGYTKEQFEAEVRSPYDTIAPEDQPRIRKITSKMNSSEKTEILEYNAVLRDGSKRFFRTVISIGRLSGIASPVQLSFLRDITEEKEGELREKRANEQVNAIMRDIDSGLTATIIKDGKVKTIFSNAQFYRMRGYTKKQYHTEIKDYYELIHPDERERVRTMALSIYSSGKSLKDEYRITMRDGSERWIRTNMTVTSFTGIEQPVVLSVYSDITAEKRAELANENMMIQLQSMMDDMPGGFCRIRVRHSDSSLEPIYINDGLCKLIGFTKEEIMPYFESDSFAGIHPDDVYIVKNAIIDMCEYGEVRSPRYRLLCKSGEYVWVSIFGRVSTDNSEDLFLNIYYIDASNQISEEENQKALLDNLPGGAGIYEFCNGEISLIYQNASYWNMVGLGEEAYPDKSPLSAIHPDDIPVMMQELSLALSQQRDITCNIRMRNLTLGYRLVHLAGRIIKKDEERFVIYATFTPNDIEGQSYQQMLPVLLSTIMESTTDLSFAKDDSFRYLCASRSFLKIVGIESEKEIIGKTDYDLFSTELADKYRRDDIALLSGDNALVDMVELIPSSDEIPHYSKTSKYILRDSLGKAVGLYGIGRDITNTIAQETRLGLVADTIPGGIASYACNSGDFMPEHIKIVYYNDGFCRLFGYSQEEFDKLDLSDPIRMIFKEDRRMLIDQWIDLIKFNKPINCIYRAHLKNCDNYKWISHKAVIADSGNDKIIINAILQDVTDQKVLIERLRISEEENNLAVMLGGNIIARYVIADKTLTLSPEVASAYSLSQTMYNVPQEPLNLGLISPESADAYTEFFDAIISGHKTATAIFQQNFTGKWHWLEARASTVFSDTGEPAKAVIVFTNVTERLEKEKIFRKWQQSMNEKNPSMYSLYRCNLNDDDTFSVSEGTLLTFDFDNAGATFNERVKAYATQCVFEDDREEYIKFLNIDTMLAEYCRGHRSESFEYRELMPDGAVRWLRLLVDLVEYPTSTDIEAYLMYENIDKAKKIELKIKRLSETDPLTGLLNRSTFIKKTDEILCKSKPGALHAMLMLDIDGFKLINDVFGHATGDQALLDITDEIRSVIRSNGLVARLGGDEFLMFLNDIPNESAASYHAQQICAAVRKSFSAEVHISGSIGISVAPRDGTDFASLYKHADSALYHVKGSSKDGFNYYNETMDEETLKPEIDRISGPATETAVKRRRILIVDDNIMDFNLLQNIFKNEFIIEKAKDGNTALIRLRHYSSAISAVLLDLRMPGMDGFAVLSQMRQTAELHDIPVIIVSSDESRESCLRAIREGATDYVTKPVDPEILRIRLRSAVSRAENDQLRSQNSLLKMQQEERLKFETAISSVRIAFIENDWIKGTFLYHPSVSRCLYGKYDDRSLWQILLSDMVADTQTVQIMQNLVHRVANDRKSFGSTANVNLLTPQKAKHSFRMVVRKIMDTYDLTSKLIITLTDLDYDEEL